MADLMKEVRERIRRQRYYQNEDLLRVFIAQVESGVTPPDFLLQFMADGAREFLRGGKPWQKGKGGRPQKSYGPDEIRHYLLHYYGRLSDIQIGQALDLLDYGGKDRTKTIGRAVKRGQLAFCMAKIGQISLLKELFAELIGLAFDDLTEGQRRKCVEGLQAGLADLLRDDLEPIYT
jgi:hypothetical protein